VLRLQIPRPASFGRTDHVYAEHSPQKTLACSWEPQNCGTVGKCVGTFIGENPGNAEAIFGLGHIEYSPTPFAPGQAGKEGESGPWCWMASQIARLSELQVWQGTQNSLREVSSAELKLTQWYKAKMSVGSIIACFIHLDGVPPNIGRLFERTDDRSRM
jgi:hypothetical protein